MSKLSTWLLRAVLVVLLSTQIYSQETEDSDPLSSIIDLIESNEIILVWSEGQEGNISSNQKIYKFWDLVIDSISVHEKETVDGVDGVFGNQHVAVATGDFNGDGYDNIVVAWEGNDRKIELLIPNINVETLSLSATTTPIQVNGRLFSGGDDVDRRIHLVTGDFDGDRQDEILVAFHGNLGNACLQIYDTDGGLIPKARGAINDEVLFTGPGGGILAGIFSVATGDFDFDGNDEIVLGAFDQSQDLYAKIYDVTGEGSSTIIAKIKRTIISKPDFSFSVSNLNMAVATGDFTDKYFGEEIAIAARWGLAVSAGADDTFLNLIRVVPDTNPQNPIPLAHIVFDEKNVVILRENADNPLPVNLASGDLNGDFQDEIVLGVSRMFIFESDSMLKATERKTISPTTKPDDYIYSNSFIDVADVNRNLRNNIVIVKNTYEGDPVTGNITRQSFRLQVYEVDDAFSENLLIELDREERVNFDPNTENAIRHYAVAFGDFDGDRILLGKPNVFERTDVLSPLIILNAPPTHFDVINDTTFDINRLFFNSPLCNFLSTYQQETSETLTFQTQVNSDWAVSASAGANVSLLGLDLGAKLTRTYGKKFSKSTITSSTITVRNRRSAQRDDEIFAYVIDYKVYEYPVIETATKDILGHVVAIVPDARLNQWAGSRSIFVDSFMPTHEVGNILSYPTRADDIDNIAALVKLGEDGTDTGFVIGDQPCVEGAWSLTIADFSSVDVMESFSVSTEVGSSVSGFGVDVGVTGNYSNEEISTQTSTSLSQIDVDLTLSSVDLSVGNTRYRITPVMYWANNGAFVLDYLVKPELSPNVETFWSKRYGNNPDPAFILPWRYTEAKGQQLDEPALRYRTKDITFTPRNPVEGEVVTISAIVHNHSLLETQGPVKVRFYVGDPDNGGTLITSSTGQTEIVTNDFIPERGRATVELEWEVPDFGETNPRIYAKIDPLDEITEIHENNNKGWVTLRQREVLTSIDEYRDVENANLVKSFELMQNYPNPFNPSTAIEYAVLQTGHVTLKVFNLLGEVVATLVDKSLAAGQYSVRWEASGLASGVYFYRLEAVGFVQTKKLILLR